jgi:lysophospholipase L1-like esterase
MRSVRAVIALVIVATASCGPRTDPAIPPLPRRIAAIGDSITRATSACCVPGDQPGRSWSVGRIAGDGVQSHLERVAAADPEVRMRAFNLAVAGATVADLARQAALAARWRADYVTILIGANDVCRSPSSRTSVGAFRARFGAAIGILQDGVPEARVFVASIPNVVRLWQVFRDDPTARRVWRTAGTCPSVLSTSATATTRAAVLERLRSYNAVLGRACAAHPRCRFDGGAVFRYAFGRDEVSSLDRFHPSVEGQAAIARITWSRSWWS